MRGLFVSFEGVDGVGKSSIMQELVFFLQQSYRLKLFLTKEPTDNRIGSYIKKTIFDRADFEETYQSYLFLADRLHHLQAEINPAIQEGKLVLCDRYHDSTIAYQGTTKEKRDFFYNMYNWQILRVPDLTIWIDAKIDILQKRLESRKQKNSFDQESADFFLQVQQNYRWLFTQESKRIVLVENNAEKKKAVAAAKAAIIDFMALS